MKKLAFLTLACISTSVFAKPMQVELIGENWTLGYDIGEVAFYAATIRDGYFQYVATTNESGNSSMMFLEVKDIIGQSNEMCYDKLWKKNAKYYEADNVNRPDFIGDPNL